MFIVDIRSSARISHGWADELINEIREDFLFRDSDAEEIAEAVRMEQVSRIDEQRNRFDGALRSLKVTTILRKGHGLALYDTGGLRNSWIKKKIKDGYRVTTTGKYKDIASMLNDGTSKMEAFYAFGVESGTMIDREIDRIIDNILNRKNKLAA